MAAPHGNQFWKLRSKHGRDRLFTEPELLWEAANEYFQWCKDNPLYESKPFSYQGETTLAIVPIMRTPTKTRLCYYLRCSESYFRKFKSSLKETDKDFFTVIDDIETYIESEQIEAAAAGILKENIVSRLLGLSDKTENKHTIENPKFPEWFKEGDNESE